MSRRHSVVSRRGSALRGFLPTDLPGCVLWLRADLGITLNGSNVSAWADQSGNGNNVSQGTGASQPTYHASGGSNGTAYLALASANAQWLGNASAAPLGGGTSMTMFVTAQAASTGSAMRAVHIGNRPSTFNGFAMTIAGDAINHRDFEFAGVAFDVDTTNNATTNWELWTMTSAAGPAQSMRVNGSAHTLSPNNSVPAAPTAGVTVGGLRSTAGAIVNFWNGNVGEVILYSRSLAASEITSVEGYVRARTAIW